MEIDIKISYPDLWGDAEFGRKEWGNVNFLIGPNASGKTIFAEILRGEIQKKGISCAYLSAERLAGFEKTNYGSHSASAFDRGLNFIQAQRIKSEGVKYGLSTFAYLDLKNKPDILFKIEAVLSEFFGKNLILREVAGNLRPFIRVVENLKEYDLKVKECHGLKEIITLLAFIYDEESDYLIIDEPELHLHPQLQSFVLQEIRKKAEPQDNGGGTDKTKKFFICTHSPYLVELRTTEDLKNCIVFRYGKLPTYIDDFYPGEERLVKSLLPKLNAHLKQFLFSERPVFVEGPTDQQLFTIIQEKRRVPLGGAGVCFLDVGGKDELGAFYWICRKLGIDARFIADLDALIESNLKKHVLRDDRFLNTINERGQGVKPNDFIGPLWDKVDECIKELKTNLKTKEPALSGLGAFANAFFQTENERKRRTLFFIALWNIREELEKHLINTKTNLGFITKKLEAIIDVFNSTRVYFLARGELEHYLPSFKGNPYDIKIGDKQKSSTAERDYLLTEEVHEDELTAHYTGLLEILDAATEASEIDYRLHIKKAIFEIINGINLAFANGEVVDEETLKKHPDIPWKAYKRIIDLISYETTTTGYKARMKLIPSIDPLGTEFEINENTTAVNFNLDTG